MANMDKGLDNLLRVVTKGILDARENEPYDTLKINTLKREKRNLNKQIKAITRKDK